MPYNRTDLFEEAFRRHAHELAAVICEPVYYNAGCIVPDKEFMDTLRRRTRAAGVLLIFDEVLTAFRMCPGGAQEFLGVTPDLCTLGKAVGGGFPLSVFGGRKDIMDRLMPVGDCQHSGTYNGHVVAVAAAIAAVTAYREPGFYEHLNAVGQRLFEGLNAIFARHSVAGRVQGLGGGSDLLWRGETATELPGCGAPPARTDAAVCRISDSAGCLFSRLRWGGVPSRFFAAMTVADAEAALARIDAAVAGMVETLSIP